MSIYNKLDLTGWKPRQLTPKEVRFATWIAFFAWVFAVYDFILFGTLLPEIGRHFNWGEVEQAQIATWVAVGTAVVALAIGPIVDKLGRRKGIIFTVAGSATSTYFGTLISTTVSRISTNCAAPVFGCVSSLRRSAQW